MDVSLPSRWPAGRVALVLGLAAAVLTIAHLVTMQIVFNDDLGLATRWGLEYWHLSMFDLDEEASFGTWFSAVILLMAGRLLLARARLERAKPDPSHVWWLVLGVGFHLLSLDEVVGMHEVLNRTMEHTAWTSVAFWIVAVVGLAYLPFVWRYRWRTGGLFLAGGALYTGGAVGVEHWISAMSDPLGYNMWTAVEEGMEMVGVIVFIYALIDGTPGVTSGTSASARPQNARPQDAPAPS